MYFYRFIGPIRTVKRNGSPTPRSFLSLFFPYSSLFLLSTPELSFSSPPSRKRLCSNKPTNPPRRGRNGASPPPPPPRSRRPVLRCRQRKPSLTPPLSSCPVELGAGPRDDGVPAGQRRQHQQLLRALRGIQPPVLLLGLRELQVGCSTCAPLIRSEVD